MLRILRLTLPACLALICLLPEVSPAQVKLLRHPTCSKGRVAFSYLGDIWVARDNGSDIQRLTDNKARDSLSALLPDGSPIAFSSNRDGNYDVFVVPVTGGKPKQLTFHTADDNVVGWTPDGKKVIFSSARGKGVFPIVVTLFEVSVDGGTEQPVPTDWGASASYSPDGETGLHAASRSVDAQTLSRLLRGRSLGGTSLPIPSISWATTISRAIICGLCTARRRHLFRQRPHAQ